MFFGYAPAHPSRNDFAKNRDRGVHMKLVGSWIVNLTASPNAEQQTDQLRLIFLFRQKQKAAQDTPDG